MQPKQAMQHHSAIRPLRSAALLSTLALGALAAAPAHALVFRADCNSLSGYITGRGQVFSPDCSDNYSDGTGTRAASASASTRLGVLKASSMTQFTATDGISSANAVAQWQMDGIVINAPNAALQGQEGRLYYDATFHGSISASGAAEVRVVLSGGNINYTGYQDSGLYSALINPAQSHTSDRTKGRFIPFVYGEEINLRFQLTTLAWRGKSPTGLMYTGDGMGYVDYANSFYWGGISDITDGSGNSVAGYTLSAPMGFNLMAPVPEPQTYALFGAGLLVLASRLRKAKQQG